MINQETAKKIDENTLNDIPLENRVKQIKQDADKMITIRPQLFINSLQLELGNDAKINKSKSKLTVEIESMAKEEHKIMYQPTDKTKIRTPFPNKRILSGGTLHNRTFLEGFSFIPDNDEGFSLGSETEENVRDKYKITAPSHIIIDNQVEQIEYNAQTNNELKLLETLSIPNFEDSQRIKQVNGFKQYLADKYTIFPYKVTEKWNLAIDFTDINGEKYTIEESHGLVVSYYMMVIGYKRSYLAKQINKESIIGEVALLGKRFGNNNVTCLGKHYNDFFKTDVDIEVNNNVENKEKPDVLLLPKIYKKDKDYTFYVNQNQDMTVDYFDVYRTSLLPILE